MPSLAARIATLLTLGATLFIAVIARAEPAEETVSVPGIDSPDVFAAARFSGMSAVADSSTDTIVIMDAENAVVRTITRPELSALVPWMNMSASPDGVTAMVWTDSGRRLYIAIADASPAMDGGASDAVLLYDRYENALARFARLELSAVETEHQHLAAAHHKGLLYVSDDAGAIQVLTAGRNQSASQVQQTLTPPDSTTVHGLAVDHGADLLLAATEFGLYRSLLSSPSAFDLITFVSGARAIAWSSHYGGPGDDGLYVLSSSGGNSIISHLTPSEVRINIVQPPAVYTTSTDDRRDLGAAFDGSLRLGTHDGLVRLHDTDDARLGIDDWIEDEFQQVLTYAKGLVSPDGEPSGWVIDADVAQGSARYHPATPDAACWTILMLLASEHVSGDSDAQPMVREILNRYAGLSPSGPSPVRSADGFYQHWIDPFTGSTQSGWPFEYATYSTMKIALAAIRASAIYPDDQEIQAAAREIVCGITNWDAYFRPANDEVYLIGSAGGGPVTNAWNPAFTEGILYVELAGAFGGSVSANAWSRWIDRSLWPTATHVLGRPITGEAPGVFQPAFITAYPLLLTPAFRNDPSWMLHAENLLISHAAWSDENGPELMTVFSAGTTKPEWGGYHADSISDHPGDITTLPALMALSATGESDALASAYHAYRNGARQDFATGASMLYRRSAIDPQYAPGTAGLPDVAMGALALAEVLSPGTIDAVLATETPENFCDEPCIADVNGDGVLTPADFTAWINAFNTNAPNCDQNADGVCSPADFSAWISNYSAGC